MKKCKKIMSMLTSLLIAAALVFGVSGQMVKAAEETESSIGYMDRETRGAYLQSGYSQISKVGSGKIAVGGTTTAQRVVSTVSINVNVERKVNGDWEHYTSWTSTKNNAVAVTFSKTITVPKGYYYRVRSVHYANSDVSSSATNGLYV
nr:DUF6147 family protein [uncultured Sellimonas sp.]